MIAGPVSPGVGRPVYQPAREKSAGTSSVPSRLRPSGPIGAVTPTAATSTRIGGEGPNGADEAIHGRRSGRAAGDRAGRGATEAGRRTGGAVSRTEPWA